MKKHLIILSAIALASFASCTKEVVSTTDGLGNEIGFKAVAQKATKADGAIVTSTTFPEDNTFKVWGYYDKEATSTGAIAYDDNIAGFMTGVVIKYTTNPANPDTPAWRNSEKSYYWPNTGAIDFVAVAPSTITTSDDSKDGFKVNDYTIAATAADATAMTRTTDLMFGHAAGMNRTTELPLTFTHALSQIAINIKTNSDYKANDGAEFYVNSVKIKNIDLSGDLTYTRSTDTGAWSDNTDLDDVLVYSTTSQEATYSAGNGVLYTEALVMIPQTFRTYTEDSDGNATGTKAQFEISYTLKQANSDEQIGTVYVDVPMSKVGTADSSYVWAIKTKYTYILNFKLNEITFSPSVNTWIEADVVTSDIQ